MASAPNPTADSTARARKGAFRRARGFWERVTEGLAINQLWGQFKSEAEAGYALYSHDVDWDSINREQKKWKRKLRSGWALFQALLMKLSPARRVLLLLALILLVSHPEFHGERGQVSL